MIRKVWKNGSTLIISIPQETANLKDIEVGDLIEIQIINIHKKGIQLKQKTWRITENV